MNKEVEDWLKYTDGVVIECEEDEITPHTLVPITPFYEKSGEHLVEGQKTILLKEAFKINKRQIVKGQKLIDYLNSRIGKKEFD